MLITAIVKHKNGSYDVYVDGEKFDKLDALVLANNRNIKVGAEISLEQIREIKKASGANFAFDAGIKYISRSMHTEKEVRKKLLDRGYGEQDVNSAIDKLKEYGYVDDTAYVRAYVTTYGKNRGKIRLAYELSNKGIDRDTIEEFLPCDEKNSARATAESKLYKYSEKDKLLRYLMSRGYDYETSKEVADELINGTKND